MEIIIFAAVLVFLILSITIFRISPFLALLFFGLLYGILSGLGLEESLSVLMRGFADTFEWIAIIMIFGAIIGEILNETGGSRRIAHTSLTIFGEKKLPVAMGVTGFTLLKLVHII